MAHKREDRRVQITKQVIRESLFELMNSHPISKISVKMICETADINRSTFYAHYRDQYDLLRAVQRAIIADVKAQIFPEQFFPASDSAVSVLVQVLQYGKSHAVLLRVLLSENGDSSFQNELMELAQEKIMDEMQGAQALPPHTIQYLKRFAVAGLLSIMRYWMETDCADEPEVVADLMLKLLEGGTKGLYMRP